MVGLTMHLVEQMERGEDDETHVGLGRSGSDLHLRFSTKYCI